MFRGGFFCCFFCFSLSLSLSLSLSHLPFGGRGKREQTKKGCTVIYNKTQGHHIYKELVNGRARISKGGNGKRNIGIGSSCRFFMPSVMGISKVTTISSPSPPSLLSEDCFYLREGGVCERKRI